MARRMDKATLQAILRTAETTETEGGSEVPEGRSITLYASHGGVSLSVPKICSLRLDGGIVTAKTARGETYVVELADLFAASIEGAAPAVTRKAGFV